MGPATKTALIHHADRNRNGKISAAGTYQLLVVAFLIHPRNQKLRYLNRCFENTRHVGDRLTFNRVDLRKYRHTVVV